MALTSDFGMRVSVGVTVQIIVQKKIYLKLQSNSDYSAKISWH